MKMQQFVRALAKCAVGAMVIVTGMTPVVVRAEPLLVFSRDARVAQGNAQARCMWQKVAGHSVLALRFGQYIPSKNRGWPFVSFPLAQTVNHLTDWSRYKYGYLSVTVRNLDPQPSELGVWLSDKGGDSRPHSAWLRYTTIPAASTKTIVVPCQDLRNSMDLNGVGTLSFIMRRPPRDTHFQILAISLIPPRLGAKGEMRLMIDVPHLRDTYFPSSNERTLAGRVVLHLTSPQLASLKLVLALDGKAVKTWAPPRSGVNDFSLPRPAFGTTHAQPLRVRLVSAHGRTIDQRVRMLKLVPRAPDAVTLREDGQCLVNGRPFYPIGIFQAPASAFKSLKTMGINTVQTYIPADAHYLQQAKKYGLRVLTPVTGAWPLQHTKQLDPQAVQRYMAMCRDSGAVLGYYIYDEPDLSEVSPAYLAAISKAVSKADPYHLTVGVCNHEYGSFAGTADVMMPDTYPIPGDWAVLLDRLTQARDSMGGRGALWHTPQCFPQLAYPPPPPEGGRPPTFDEMRAMVYTGLAFGVRGTIFYSYAVQGFAIKDAYPHLWQAFGDVIKEMHGLRRILAAPSGSLRVARNDQGILAATREYNGHAYLFAVNSSPRKTVEAVLHLRGAKPNGRWIVVSEGRSVTVRHGVLRDKFQPLAVHIYTTAPRDPSPIRLAAVRRALEQAQREHPLPLAGDLADLAHGAKVRSSFGWPKHAGVEGWQRMIDGYPGAGWVIGDDFRAGSPRLAKALHGERWIEVDLRRPESIGRLAAVTSEIKPTLKVFRGGRWEAVKSESSVDRHLSTVFRSELELPVSTQSTAQDRVTTTVARFPPLKVNRFRLYFRNARPGGTEVIFELEAYRQ